jgi:hypothetical protein
MHCIKSKGGTTDSDGSGEIGIPRVGFIGGFPRKTMGQFEVLTRLRSLRNRIEEWQADDLPILRTSESEELQWVARGLAIAARIARFDAYGALCLHLAELLENASATPREALVWFSQWVLLSSDYIRDPRPVAVAGLLAHINDPRWHSPFDETERALLSHALLEPAK